VSDDSDDNESADADERRKDSDALLVVAGLFADLEVTSGARPTVRVIRCTCRMGQWPCECESEEPRPCECESEVPR